MLLIIINECKLEVSNFQTRPKNLFNVTAGKPLQTKGNTPIGIYRHSSHPSKPALKKAQDFGGSHDLVFMDEDSDDEVSSIISNVV